MMDKIPRRAVTTHAMVAGNEAKYRIVVEGGFVREWVGIGWIELRPATPEDLEKYPTVEDCN